VYWFVKDPAKLSCPNKPPPQPYAEATASGRLQMMAGAASMVAALNAAAPKKGDGQTNELSSPDGTGPPLNFLEMLSRNLQYAGDGGQRVAGDLLGVGTAVFYAGYILCVADLRGRCSTVSILWASGAAACPPLLLVAVLSGEALLPVDARGWWVLIGLALVSQVAGQGLIAYSLAHLPAALSSLTLLLQPVCAALFAWALLAEALGARQALGGAVVLAGVALARRASRPPGLTRPAPPPSRP
jgi:drug/metabolite transporter (DMT)-like permease